jgi:hypothetical protein
MASVLCDVGRWREHAQAARELSEVISDFEEKQQLLIVAAGFDRIAELAKEQATLYEECPLSDWASVVRFPRAPGQIEKSALS